MGTLTTAQLRKMGVKVEGPKHKYNVSPKADRTWNGKTYDSKAEMQYARMLWGMISTGYAEIIEQPRLWLGVREVVYVPDFLVVPLLDLHVIRDSSVRHHDPYYIDVKGMETPAFKKVKKLWARHARLDLHIVAWKGTDRFETREIVHGTAHMPSETGSIGPASPAQ